METVGPQTLPSQRTFQLKYAQHGEGFRDVMNRVAWSLCDTPEHYHAFRRMLLAQQFIPAGRILAGIGASKSVTAMNCYVSGTIADSFVDDVGSIMDRATEAAATMRMGGGIGYDFSPLRPRNDLIRGLQSHSSGPVSFMRIYDQVGLCTSSSGHRRGAQMGMLRVDHPDIEEFILAKRPSDQAQSLWDMVNQMEDGRRKDELRWALQSTLDLTGFNISVAVTDEFMDAVARDGEFDLRFQGRTYRTVRARELWEKIMRSTWDWAEPGVVFIDRINAQNNLHYCETIAATNPCGEQPLPPYGCCLLGSLNLVKFVHPKGEIGDAKDRFWFDEDGLRAAIPFIVRAMDRVLDVTDYPLQQQKQEAMAKRRMGIGITGLANALGALGLEYGSDDAVLFTEKVLSIISNETYRASAMLALERGAFPAFRRAPYMDSAFITGLDPDVRDLIARNGIRNSHLTSIAPTGTISFCADNVSSGIEPVFSHRERRIVNLPEGPEEMIVEDYAFREWGVECPTANDLGTDAHVKMLCAAARGVDSSVSKTVNVPSSIDWDDFKDIYKSVYENGGKACATFTTEGNRIGIREAEDCSDGGSCSIAA